EDYIVRFTGNGAVTVDGESSVERILCSGCELTIDTDYSCSRFEVAAMGTIEILDAQSQQIDRHTIRCPRDDHYLFSVGQNYSIASDEKSRLWSWGANDDGQLGNGTYIPQDRPLPFDLTLPANTQVLSVVSGGQHNLLLTSDGRVRAWGYNYYSQVGVVGEYRVGTPFLLDAALFDNKPIVSVAAGYGHSVALDEDNGIWVWGRNNEGQLGNSTTVALREPYLLPSSIFGDAKPVAIASGTYHNLMLDDQGRLWGWGYNYYGQLGDNSRTNRLVPTLIDNMALGVDRWSNVSVGLSHTLALDSAGRLWSWGSNNYGELGDGTTTLRSLPTLMDTSFLDDAEIVAIAAGDGFSLILDDLSRIWGWGRNGEGQLGDGDSYSRVIPDLVNLDKLGNVKPI